MTIEMSLDYYQKDYGSVLDYLELIYYKDIPYSFGWVCLVKLDNGRYGISKLARNGTGSFDWPAPTFELYKPAHTYWAYYKKRLMKDQELDQQDYIRRKQALAGVH